MTPLPARLSTTCAVTCNSKEIWRRQRAAAGVANVVRFSGGLPGHRTYDVSVGVGAADRHANVLEMLPQQLNLIAGDKVRYQWKSPNAVHTVGFPADSPALPAPFGFDCGSSFQSPPNGPGPFAPCIEPGAKQPEFVGDPGSSPSGTGLKNPSTLVKPGYTMRRGADLEPTSQKWSLGTNSSTVAATYEYQC